MIGDKSVLGLIVARGGSKGLPRKNIRQIGGKPMIAWTVEAGKQSQCIDRLILSSEDDEIIEVVRQLECDVPFVRPKNLATDESSPIEVIRHAIESLPEKYDYLVLLQPTSPLRIANDIDRCVELCYQKKAPACVTITESEKTPYWMYELREDHRLHSVLSGTKRIVRRQDLPKTYTLNGAVFVARSDWIIYHDDFLGPDTIGCEMPRVRSIDIDSATDLIVADAIFKETGLG
ncbi:MAG: acylneuraminate cytidylyltransferase [Nitrospina sp.]|nr:acylneuraminate cytidylyltransferase [Nitrospina sp.]|tara:strand:+ start:2324 stop:3022 length:699 start_codon:yes stop_codon:yes gene_type:complete